MPLDYTIRKNESAAAFKEMWDRVRGDNELPAWRDFDIMDFRPWWGWICMYELDPDADFDFVIRLWGTAVTNFYGVELTGKRASELLGLLYWEEDLMMKRYVRDRKCMGIAAGPMNWEHQHYKTYSYFVLPLADDGTTVDRLMLVIIPDGRERRI